MCRYPGFEAFQEICNLVYERVFVPNLKSRDPPVAHVGLVAIGNVNIPPTSHDRIVAMIKVLQAM